MKASGGDGFVRSVDAGHELSDVHVGGVLAFGVALAGVLAALLLVLWALVPFMAGTQSVAIGPKVSGGDRVPPSPRLQVDPREELRLLRRAEDERLDSYGWIDRQAGVVHIPIDEAMRRTVARGLPAREGK